MNVWPGPLQLQMGFRSDYGLRATSNKSCSECYEDATNRSAVSSDGGFVFCGDETRCGVKRLISSYLCFLGFFKDLVWI